MRLLTLATVLLPAVSLAETSVHTMRNVPDYCGIVQQRILVLEGFRAATDEDLKGFAADQSAATAQKIKEARDHLKAYSEGLKDTEEEWARLGCAQILYPKK